MSEEDQENIDAIDEREFENNVRETKVLKSVASWIEGHLFSLVVPALLFAFGTIYFWSAIVHTVRAGEEGVMWRRFSGTDLDTLYMEGVHVILPWNELHIYDVRIQKLDHTIQVLSTDGLEIDVEVSTRYRPVAKTVPQLHQNVGPDYVERIIVPEVITAVREVMGQYRPEELYALNTGDMQRQIVSRAAIQARDRFVIIDDVLVRRIHLPEFVQTAIQNKLGEEQEMLEYEYRIEKERREAQRKVVEAQGIKEFQQIISTGIEEPYLRWRGIEATLKLAESNNAKLVVIGNSDGLPLILNTESTLPAVPGTP